MCVWGGGGVEAEVNKCEKQPKNTHTLDDAKSTGA